MQKLNFPIIKGRMPQGKCLSMNDYWKFVSFNVKHAYDKEDGRYWKKKLVVDIPFTLQA